eukprot:TRINITY_DN19269_c0_g1_i1.p1 TRINITY_DN19269_c0_g1~~TRINITY_DN19269_c0_g1_i1.p1  ORF type:complete len:351 (+),score=80.61 TRINITY_DN19269_c0_g1_i1:135-1055(+)
MGQKLPTLQCCHENERENEVHISSIGSSAMCGSHDDLNDEHFVPAWVEVQPCHTGLVNCMSQSSPHAVDLSDTRSCQAIALKAYGDVSFAGNAFMDEGAGAADCGERSLESLSYLPVRFDEADTYDVERSRERYSKVLVHGTRARTQRGAKWDAWLRGAALGRGVTLLSGGKDLDDFAGSTGGGGGAVERIVSTYMIDGSLTRLSILPCMPGNGHVEGARIEIRKIQSVCSATDIMMMLDQMDAVLTEAEKARAIILQYLEEDEASGTSAKRRVCFLEQSALAKEQFVEAVTALWLEKRNDHSMWF